MGDAGSDLKPLQKSLGYRFSCEELLDQALTHGSAGKQCNERLEFLGDAILGAIIAQEVYRRYPELPEGSMSRLRANLVNGKRLAQLATQFSMGAYLRLGYGERKSGGAERASTLADALEAVVAAVFLDSDFASVQQTVLHWYAPLWDSADISSQKDAKSSLQEWLQAKHLVLPTYTLIATHGHAHDALFEISCIVEGMAHEEFATASTRRDAEQIAAAAFLQWLEANDQKG